MDGTLDEFNTLEKENFNTYIQKLINEELDEGETNPIVLEDSPYFNFQLNGIQRICFSTADDPFYKSTVSKYYPECVVLNDEGEILAKVNPFNKKNSEY